MNSLSIIGRLTGEYELKYTPSGKPVGNFSIAINDGFGENEHTSFFNVVTFGAAAERHGKYIGKGSQVGITGSIKQERWEKDGKKHSMVKITALKIDYLSSATITKEVDEADEDIPF